MLNYNKTNYPEIFKNTYWGNFDNCGEKEDEIIENRNTFIEQFKVKNIYKTKLLYEVYNKRWN